MLKLPDNRKVATRTTQIVANLLRETMFIVFIEGHLWLMSRQSKIDARKRHKGAEFLKFEPNYEPQA